MVSDAQQEANQQNALKGGVKTEAGKSVSKYNAVTHGIWKWVLTDDETREAQRIYEQVSQESEPQSTIEVLLIHKLAVAHIRFQRALNAEREYLHELYNPPVYEEHIIQPPLLDKPLVGDSINGIKEIVLVKHGYKAQIGTEQIDHIEGKFARYITTCERQFYRALHELQRVQAIRKGMKPASFAVDVNVDRDDS